MPIIMRMELVFPAPSAPAGQTYLARINRQAQVVDGDLILVGFGHSREFDNWHIVSPAVFFLKNG